MFNYKNFLECFNLLKRKSDKFMFLKDMEVFYLSLYFLCKQFSVNCFIDVFIDDKMFKYSLVVWKILKFDCVLVYVFKIVLLICIYCKE